MNTIKKIIAGSLTLVMLIVAFGFTDKTKGDVITQQRTVSAFVNLEASTGILVIVKQGDTYSITVTADANQIDKIKTTISQGTLNVHVDRSAHLGNAKVEIVVPKLKSISASSSADIRSDGELTFDKLDIEASSGADIRLRLNSKLITSNCSSGSTIHLLGSTTVLVAHASSGADLVANELEAANGKITTESGADAKVKVLEEAEFNASSGSDIKYYVQPQNITMNSSSGGDITKKESNK